MLDVQKVKIAGLNSQLVVIKSEFKTLANPSAKCRQPSFGERGRID
jgi:hypothetical protein